MTNEGRPGFAPLLLSGSGWGSGRGSRGASRGGSDRGSGREPGPGPAPGPEREVPLSALLDRDAVMPRLVAGGLSGRAAERAAQGMVRASRALLRRGLPTEAPASAFFVPGRVELLGKHTDYAGGRSLLMAVERGFSVVGVDLPGDEVEVLDAGGDEVDDVDAVHEVWRVGAGDTGGWALYPSTVVRRVLTDVPDLGGGAAVAFDSSLPPAAGMSSSSALVVALFLGFAARWRVQDRLDFSGEPARSDFGAPPCPGPVPGPAERSASRPPAERIVLAEYLAAVEAGRPFDWSDRRRTGVGDAGTGEEGTGEGARGAREGHGARGGREGHNGKGAPLGVGTEGGSEDHAAILGALAGHAVVYRFRPTVFEGSVPLPPGWTIAVASSGVRAEKAGAAREAYNRLSAEVDRAAKLWRARTGRDDPHLGAILAHCGGEAEQVEAILGDPSLGDPSLAPSLLARFRQFRAECCEILPAACDALFAEDVAAFGREVARSQALAEEVLGNQVPETVHLVRIARELGSPAASAFGAGFGGAVWALVPADDGEGFLRQWRTGYGTRFPDRIAGSTFFLTRAGPAAFRVA